MKVGCTGNNIFIEICLELDVLLTDRQCVFNQINTLIVRIRSAKPHCKESKLFL